jgi:SAM-dependent methyltransferase
VNQPAAKHLFGLQNDAEWLDLVIRSVREPIINNVHMPRFPHAFIQDRWVGSHDEQALREAYNFFALVKRWANSTGRPLGDDTRFLDFGVGWARYPRLFWYDIPSKGLYGVDIDADMISGAFVMGVPGSYSKIEPDGTLPYEDGFFDVSIAYSVFTHLPEALCERWIAELSRVTRPGGIVAYTVEPPRFLDFIDGIDPDAETGSASEWYKLLSAFKPQVPAMKESVAKGEVAYMRTLGEHNPFSEFYGDTVIPREFVQNNWGKYFELLEYLDDPKTFWQAVVIGRKA